MEKRRTHSYRLQDETAQRLEHLKRHSPQGTSLSDLVERAINELHARETGGVEGRLDRLEGMMREVLARLSRLESPAAPVPPPAEETTG